MTGKQGGAEHPRAAARVCAGSAGQSAWWGEHTGELCKQQEARKKRPASSGAMLGRNMVALGDSAHNSWAPLLPERATVHLHAMESSLVSLARQQPAQGWRDLASSRHPDVLRPDCSGYNSPASLFLLPVRLPLKNATAAPLGAASASQGTGSGHTPFLPTYWHCLYKHSPGKPSRQLAEIWHFHRIQ